MKHTPHIYREWKASRRVLKVWQEAIIMAALVAMFSAIFVNLVLRAV